jgi:hypothetical protein
VSWLSPAQPHRPCILAGEQTKKLSISPYPRSFPIECDDPTLSPTFNFLSFFLSLSFAAPSVKYYSYYYFPGLFPCNRNEEKDEEEERCSRIEESPSLEKKFVLLLLVALPPLTDDSPAIPSSP